MLTTRTAFLAAVGFGGLLLTFCPSHFSGFGPLQPEAGDILLNNDFLEHSYRWAFDRGYPFSLWSPGFYYPTPYVFTYSETLIGTAPLYWLLRVGFSETVACQLWIMITYALNFAAMAVVLRWFGVNTVLTAAGAYVFAFGLIRVDHLTHQQLMPQYFSPFAVWNAWAFLREPSARRWALVMALCGLQILAGLHLGWFLGFRLFIFIIQGLVFEPGRSARVRQFGREQPLSIFVPLRLAGGVVGAYARNFYKGTPSPRAYWEAAMYCPYPDGWFVATPGSLWADHLTPRSPDDFPEKALFQGCAVYAVFLAAGWYALRRQDRPGILSPLSASERGAGGERSRPDAPPRPLPLTASPQQRGGDRGLVLANVGTAAILALLVTRWGYDVSLWFLVHQTVPGANAFRAVGRIAFVAYLFGMVGGLVGVQALVT